MSELKKGILERQKKGKKPTTFSGLMQKILVYEHGKPMGEAALIGSGWVEINPITGTMYTPNLYDFQGVRMPMGWYQLVPTEEYTHIVLPRNRRVVQ